MRPQRVALLGAMALVAYQAVVRPWLRGWGATNSERRAALPGDNLVHGRYQSTHAITIGTSPAEVWPWIVQLGYGRGGWYSYDRLERAVGAGEFAEGGSARRIVADLQELAVGDTVLLSPNGGLTVIGLEAPRSLVLHYRMDAFSASPASARSRAVLDWTWVFVLRPVAEGCRLLVRVRGELSPRWLAVALPLLEATGWVMERKMLLGLKQRAEQRGPQRRRSGPRRQRRPEACWRVRQLSLLTAGPPASPRGSCWLSAARWRGQRRRGQVARPERSPPPTVTAPDADRRSPAPFTPTTAGGWQSNSTLGAASRHALAAARRNAVSFEPASEDARPRP